MSTFDEGKGRNFVIAASGSYRPKCPRASSM